MKHGEGNIGGRDTISMRVGEDLNTSFTLDSAQIGTGNELIKSPRAQNKEVDVLPHTRVGPSDIDTNHGVKLVVEEGGGGRDKVILCQQLVCTIEENALIFSVQLDRESHNYIDQTCQGRMRCGPATYEKNKLDPRDALRYRTRFPKVLRTHEKAKCSNAKRTQDSTRISLLPLKTRKIYMRDDWIGKETHSLLLGQHTLANPSEAQGEAANHGQREEERQKCGENRVSRDYGTPSRW